MQQRQVGSPGVAWTSLQQPLWSPLNQQPKKVIKAAKISHEITIEAWVKPANDSQKGPARIATLSADSRERNFTLGQRQTKYVTRLRTTKTNENGTTKKLTAGDVTTDRLSHRVCTRDADGMARFYLNATEAGKIRVNGDFSSWVDSYHLGLANQFTKEQRAWLGKLHLVAIYSRALTPAEVSQNFLAGTS